MKRCVMMAFVYFVTLLPAQTPAPYGSNPQAGKYAPVNDIKMYYEMYGDGAPLLLISGNNGSIVNWATLIPVFAKKYRVIACDSRAQGRSYDSEQMITYALMASDYNQLLNTLKLDSVYVLGWSDGGIIGLEMAINYPNKIKKLIAAGANFTHDSTAIYPKLLKMVTEMKTTPFEQLPELFQQSYKTYSPQPERARIIFNKLMDLMLKYPNFTIPDLAKIQCPVLVLAGDHDLIREEHTIKLFQSIPHSQLAILPGTSHISLLEKPELVHKVIDEFLSTPYKEINRYYFLE